MKEILVKCKDSVLHISLDTLAMASNMPTTVVEHMFSSIKEDTTQYTAEEFMETFIEKMLNKED